MIVIGGGLAGCATLTLRGAGASSGEDEANDVDAGSGTMAAIDDAPDNATPHLWHVEAVRWLMASHA